MNSPENAKLTHDQLVHWEAKLNSENCTPLLLLGIGHDRKFGELRIHVPPGVQTAAIQHILELACAALSKPPAPVLENVAQN